MKYLIFILCLFIFSIKLVNAQPLRYSENDFKLDEEAVGWEPAPIDLSAGDLKLTVWILKRLVPAPDSGYLILRSDWIEIRRMLDSLNEEISRVKNLERESCDKSLKEKDVFCQNLNKDLINQIDNFKKDIKEKNSQIISLEKENLWTKIISGVAIIGLSGISIYQATK